MAITKLQTSSVSAFLGNSSTVVSGTATGYQRTITVTSGSLLTAVVWVRNVNAAGELITGISDNKAQTWTKRLSIRDNSVEDGYGWLYLFDCYNAEAGSTTVSLDFTIEDTNNYTVWCVEEYSGIASSSAYDTGDTSAEAGPSDTITVGSVTPADADSLVIAAMGSKWWYYIDDDTPNDYTNNARYDGNSYGQFHLCHKVLSSSSGQSITWTGPADQSTTDGTLGLIAVYKAASGTNKRIRCLYDSAINGDTDITAWVWTGSFTTTYAQEFSGLTAEASGGVLLINLPSNTTLTNGQSVTVLAENSTDTSGRITGTVETY